MVDPDQVLQKAKEELFNFLSNLTQNMDFELGSKTNPKDRGGNKIPGKWEIVHVYYKQGQYVKSGLTYFPLYEITDIDRQITRLKENPIEDALRLYSRNIVGPNLPQPTTTSPTPPAPVPDAVPGVPPYVRYVGSPNIFNRYTGKYITYNEAIQLGVYNPGQIKDFTSPRPEVQVATDFAIWDGKDLTVFPV